MQLYKESWRGRLSSVITANEQPYQKDKTRLSCSRVKNTKQEKWMTMGKILWYSDNIPKANFLCYTLAGIKSCAWARDVAWW